MSEVWHKVLSNENFGQLLDHAAFSRMRDLDVKICPMQISSLKSLLLLPFFALLSVQATGSSYATDERLTIAPPVEAEPTETTEETLRRVSRIEGLITLGQYDPAFKESLAIESGDLLEPWVIKTQAMAAFFAKEWETLGKVLQGEHSDPALRYLSAAALARSSEGQNEGLQKLREIWWFPEENGIWSWAALREIAQQTNDYPQKSKEEVLSIIAPLHPRFEAKYSEVMGEWKTRLQRKAPRKGRLATELAILRAKSLADKRDFESAEKLYKSLKRASKANGLLELVNLRLGEALAAKGYYRSAMRYLGVIMQSSENILAHRARAHAGQYAIESGDYERARTLFQEDLFNYPIGPNRYNALWSLGWISYRQGSFPEAERFFATLIHESGASQESERASYWHARALEEMLFKDEAYQEYAALIQTFPTSYYAYRAESRLPKEYQMSKKSALTPNPEVEAICTLLDAGMTTRAAAQLRALRPLLDSLGPDDLSRVEETAKSLNIGPIARLAYSWRWRRYAKSPDEKRKLRQLYPASYAKIITRAARKSRVAPALAIALTRQESGFRPDAVSASGALGLMQLMPQTATLLLRENKRRTKVSKEIILNPETNAKLGTTYLGRMLRAFRGNVEYALAAYNAGPGSVTKWRQARGEMPSDIFVEEIPFSETRTYVKRVLAGRRAWHLSRRTKPETIALAE